MATVSPTRLDPSRLSGLVSRLWAALKRLFAGLRSALWKSITLQDAFGLSPARGLFAPFAFLAPDAKLEAFRTWVQAQIASGLSNLNLGAFVRAAYKRGVLRAATQAKSSLGDSLLSLADRSGDKARLLIGRTTEAVRGLASDVASRLTRLFADGLAHGQTPVTLARALVRDVEAATLRRGLRLAQRELHNVFVSAQLEAFKALGIERVGAIAELVFTTAGDARVCPTCAELEGKTFTVEEARGVIPQHLGCRCIWSVA